MAKLSVLCLYRRIFSTPSFRRSSLIVGLFVVCYWVASTVGGCLWCQPPSGVWDRRHPAKCFNFAAFFLGTELVNLILDIVMLLLPLRVIRDLHMATAKKIQLCMVFLLGGL